MSNKIQLNVRRYVNKWIGGSTYKIFICAEYFVLKECETGILVTQPFRTVFYWCE